MASIARLRRAAAPVATAAALRRLLPPPHRSLPALSPPLPAAQRSRLSALSPLSAAAAAAQRSHFCTATATATSEEKKTDVGAVLQRMVDKYCFQKQRDLWPAVVEEILTRRQRRADGGEVVREYLRTRDLLRWENFHVGLMDTHAELWKNILTDYVPFSYERDHGGEIPEKLLHVVEELGEMCVNGEILGDHAYNLVTYIMEDMAKEMKANQPEPEEVQEKSKGKKKK